MAKEKRTEVQEEAPAPLQGRERADYQYQQRRALAEDPRRRDRGVEPDKLGVARPAKQG